MIALLEWLIAILVASASASATGSIFLLLVGVGGATRWHLVKYRAATQSAKGQRQAHISSPEFAQEEFGCENVTGMSG
jgi:hypothetical protein